MYNEGPATDFERGVPEADKIKFANENVFVTVMLETKGAFEHLDEIAAMPGIDAVTLGPTDLSQDLGVYGTPEAGLVLDEHRYRIIEATKKYGKATAMLVSSVEQARKWRDAGVLLLGYSSEVGVLSEGYRNAIAAMKD
jgi:2-keto-3-deoxy-L-rhamnonate aldolase RhmA